MHRNRVTSVIVSLIIAAFICLFVAAYYFKRHPEVNPVIVKQTHPLLVIDFDNQGLLNTDELLAGSDAIVAVRTGAHRDELFNSVAALSNLDANRDGHLDEHDPMFVHLELIFFTNGGKGRKYVSLTQAGIKEIILIPHRIKFAPDSVVDNLAGQAVMRDGTKHDIRLINVEAK